MVTSGVTSGVTCGVASRVSVWQSTADKIYYHISLLLNQRFIQFFENFEKLEAG
jgi:hypothetical protein